MPLPQREVQTALSLCDNSPAPRAAFIVGAEQAYRRFKAASATASGVMPKN